MRTLLIFFALFCIANSIQAQTAADVRESRNLFKEAQRNLQGDELEAFKDKVAKASELRPKHPTLMLNHAYAFTLLDEFDSAIKKLRDIADMGVYIDLSGINEFDRLSGKEGYEKMADQFGKNLNPTGQADLAFELTDPDLLVEGVTYDRQTGSFFLSSIHKQKIIEVSADGKILSETDLSLSPMGIRADSKNRSLWISLAGIDQSNHLPKEKLGQTGIAKFDLETKQIVEEYIFKKDSVDHLFGGLLIGDDNFIYLSDSKGGLIYQIGTNLSDLKPITDPQDLVSPQGLAFSVNHSTLIIADYSLGLVKVNPESAYVRQSNRYNALGN